MCPRVLIKIDGGHKKACPPYLVEPFPQVDTKVRFGSGAVIRLKYSGNRNLNDRPRAVISVKCSGIGELHGAYPPKADVRRQYKETIALYPGISLRIGETFIQS